MEQLLSKEDQRTLLKLARDTIETWVKEHKKPKLPDAKGFLGEKCGAFVTIHKKGQLRGCIGNMIGYGPLVETIQEMAVASSTGDPRFHPVRPEELSEIDIEISVLSPMREIKDINEIQVGTHGILMSRGMFHGVLLPQVATEYGWDRTTFLQHTCIKAGLPENAWQDPQTRIEIFSAQVFGEKQSTSAHNNSAA